MAPPLHRFAVAIFQMLREFLCQIRFGATLQMQRRYAGPEQYFSNQAFSTPVTRPIAATNSFQLFRCERSTFRPSGVRAVIAPPSLLGLFHPAAVDPAPLLKPVEQRIKRGDVKSQNAARSDLESALRCHTHAAADPPVTKAPEARRFPSSILDPVKSVAIYWSPLYRNHKYIRNCEMFCSADSKKICAYIITDG